MLICNNCKGAILENSLYCPHCGDPVTKDDKPSTFLDKSGIAQVEISFGQSSSANFQKAFDICKKISSFKETKTGDSTNYKISLPITEIELLINLYELVGSWKSFSMLINGQKQSKSALVYHGAGCYRNRQKAYDKNQYCFGEQSFDFNIWGCKKLQMPINEWGGGWLDYGMLDNNGIWHFDKNRIRHDLEINIHENDLCPVLNKHQIFRTLDLLPDTINPKENPKWKYRTENKEINGDYKDVAIGISPILSSANYYVLGDYKPEWKLNESDNAKNTLTLSINPSEILENTKSSSKSNFPKWAWIFLLILIFTVIYLISLN